MNILRMGFPNAEIEIVKNGLRIKQLPITGEPGEKREQIEIENRWISTPEQILAMTAELVDTYLWFNSRDVQFFIWAAFGRLGIKPRWTKKKTNKKHF